jgi:hypothetical protein
MHALQFGMSSAAHDGCTLRAQCLILMIGSLPDWLLPVIIVLAVSTTMFDLGLIIVPANLHRVAQGLGLMLRDGP